MFRHVTLPISFERFDSSLITDYLASTNMECLLWTNEDYLLSSRTLQLLIQSLNINKNYQMKWNGQGRRRRLLWFSFQLTILHKLFIHMTFIKSLWKSELAVLFRIPCSWREVTCYYNRLWEFSATKPMCYKDVFVNSFCSTTSTLVNSLIVELCLFLWLIF